MVVVVVVVVVGVSRTSSHGSRGSSGSSRSSGSRVVVAATAVGVLTTDRLKQECQHQNTAAVCKQKTCPGYLTHWAQLSRQLDPVPAL